MTALSKLLQCEIPDNVLLGLFTLTDRVIKHHHSKYVWSLREHTHVKFGNVRRMK